MTENLIAKTTEPFPQEEDLLVLKTVTSFLINLYNLVSDQESDHIVRWKSKDNKFMIIDKEMFTDQILPQYYKHTNFASFLR